MTREQLSVLLEAVPQPALVFDAAGIVIARNQAAVKLGWSSMASSAPDVEVQSLGDGWSLARRSLPGDRAAQTRENATYPADIDTLARGIVHEIRNPLAAILTGVKLVQDDPQVADETAMLLDVIRKESLRINDILSAFSDYVKPRTPRLAFFDLTLAARAVVARLRQEELLPAVLVIEDKLESPLMVWGDEDHFRSCLLYTSPSPRDS